MERFVAQLKVEGPETRDFRRSAQNKPGHRETKTVTTFIRAALQAAIIALAIAALTVAVSVTAPPTAPAVAGLTLVVAAAPVLIAVTISSIPVTLAGGGRVGRGRSSCFADALFG
jgi:hypothetical protein